MVYSLECNCNSAHKSCIQSTYSFDKPCELLAIINTSNFDFFILIGRYDNKGLLKHEHSTKQLLLLLQVAVNDTNLPADGNTHLNLYHNISSFAIKLEPSTAVKPKIF